MSRHGACRVAASVLTKVALERGSRDNITVIVRTGAGSVKALYCMRFVDSQQVLTVSLRLQLTQRTQLTGWRPGRHVTQPVRPASGH